MIWPVLLLAGVGLFLWACSHTRLGPVGPSVNPPKVLEEAAAMAVDYWNRCGLALDPPSQDAPIRIVLKQQTAPDDGKCYWSESGGWPEIQIDPVVVKLYVNVPGKMTVAARVLAHEIGHALGFPHQPDRSSVMWLAVNLPLPDPPSDIDRQLARDLMRNAG